MNVQALRPWVAAIFLLGAVASAVVGLLISGRAGSPTEEAVGTVFVLTSVVGAGFGFLFVFGRPTKSD